MEKCKKCQSEVAVEWIEGTRGLVPKAKCKCND